MAEQKYWTPTRGYLSEAGGGAAPEPAPEAASPGAGSPEAGSPDAASPAADAKSAAAAAPSGGSGSKYWTPTRGYLGGGSAPAAAPAPAAEKAAAAPAAEKATGAPAAAKPAPAAAAAAAKPKVAEAKAAAKPAAAAPAAPKADPTRESVKVVEKLATHKVFDDLGRAIYDDADSETTLYRVPTLNIFFAICSILLLGILLLVFWQDYDREWKRIQADWIEELRTSYKSEREANAQSQLAELVEVAKDLDKVLVKVQGEEAGTASVASLPATPAVGHASVVGMPAFPRYKQVVQRIEDATAIARASLEGREQYAELARTFALVENDRDLHDKKVRAFRGDFQAAKFAFEEEKRHILQNGHTQEANRRVEELTAEFNEKYVAELENLSRALEVFEEKASAARAAFDLYVAEQTAIAPGVDLVRLEGRYANLRRPVDTVESRLSLVESNWRNGLRNAPLLDALAPSYQIDKVVTPLLRESLNFLDVPRIHRCKTCHINIDSLDPAVVDWPEGKWGSVYQSHPRLDLFLSGASAHGYEQFGCTTCHYGDGHALDFTHVAHTPTSEKQSKEWEEEFHWHELHHQDFPMLPAHYTTSSCSKCHTEERRIQGAGLWNLGAELVREYGCYGCHKIDGHEIAQGDSVDNVWKLEKAGPSLRHLGDKVTEDFLLRWVRNPGHFRASTRMPRFFDLSNSRGQMTVLGSEAKAEEIDFDVRNGVEVLALSSYLLETSVPTEGLVRLGAEGDAARGRKLVKETGCMGCHSIKIEVEIPPAGELPTLAQQVEAVRAARAALRGKDSFLHRKLDTTYGDVADKLEGLFRWLERLSVGDDVEGLYHELRVAVEDARRLEGAVEVAESPLDGVEALASSVYQRWVHSTFAPDLSGVARKFDRSTPAGLAKAKDWLATWILNPNLHDPRTVMPSFRLDQDPDGEQKVADMVAYLLTLDFNNVDFAAEPAAHAGSLGDEERAALASAWDGADVMTREELESVSENRKILDEMAFTFLRASHSTEAALSHVAEMSVDHKLQFVGHRLVRRYGCYGCHNGIADVDPDPAKVAERQALIADGQPVTVGSFDTAQGIGAELNKWGNKDADRLDFGQWGHQPDGSLAIPHTRYDWLEAKLTDTRRFDVLPIERTVSEDEVTYETTDRLIQKQPDELLKMPLFPFHDDPERVRAAVSFVIGLVDDPIDPSMKKRLDETERVVEAGGRLVEKLNCSGCHRLGASPELVHVDDLPNGAASGDEARRLRVMEPETWLASHQRLIAKPVADPKSELTGLPLPYGFPLSDKVHQLRTGDAAVDDKIPEVFSQYEEPLAAGELARRHFDPLPGFVQDLAKVLDSIVNEFEGEDDISHQPLRRHVEGLLASNARSPNVDFVKLNHRLLAQGPAAGNARETVLSEFLFACLDDPYGQHLDEWAARGVGKAELDAFQSLAESAGWVIQPTPEAERQLLVEGYGEGGIRFYFGTDVATRYKAPPPLLRQGERVQSDWLFHFLLNVEPIRPWLKVRMPSFRLTQDEARLIVQWFKAKSGVPFGEELFQEDRYDREVAALGKSLFGAGNVEVGGETVAAKQCNQCHPRGTDYPTKPTLSPADAIDPSEVPASAPDDSFFVVSKDASGSVSVQAGFADADSAREAAEARFAGSETRWAVGNPWDKSSWGPDLSMAAMRLRPDWSRQWLYFPPDFMPGTKMPSFWERQRFTGIRDAHITPTAEAVVDALLQYLVHMDAAELAATGTSTEGPVGGGGD